MNRPLAYVTADFNKDEDDAHLEATTICRLLYESGYSPVCPYLAQSHFISFEVPQEYKDSRDMAHEFLRRSRILVVCSPYYTEEMMEDMAIAKKYGIATVTMDGIVKIAQERDGTINE